MNTPEVGLRRWVDANFLTPRDKSDTRRSLMVEMHHDGTAVFAVDVSWGHYVHTEWPVPDSRQPYVPVEAWAVAVGAAETIAEAHELRLALRADSGCDLTAVIVRDTDFHAKVPFAPVIENMGFREVPTTARRPVALQPAAAELSPTSDDATLRDAAQALSSGLLNQFGIELSLWM
jgi:hypothetical protein